MLQFPFKGKCFLTHPKLAYAFLSEKSKDVLYIACEMKFKDKTYGLNLLLALNFKLRWN